jgi:predicted transcriptional regulator
MPRTASLNVRIEPHVKERLERLADSLDRTKSYLAERAIEAYLEANEWQIQAIREALKEADSDQAEWVDHDDLKTKWAAKRAD